MPIKHGELWKIDIAWVGALTLGTKEPSDEQVAVEQWFAAMDHVLGPIKQIDEVVSLVPFCAKLLVAPEQKGCSWRRRKRLSGAAKI